SSLQSLKRRTVRENARASARVEASRMNAFVTVFYDWSRAVARQFTWAAPLAVRITVGVVFAGTGWTKLTHLPQIIDNFRGLGIPAPEVITPFVSGVEFIGGLMLLLGFMTPFFAVPLMGVMVVGVITPQRSHGDFLWTLLWLP